MTTPQIGDIWKSYYSDDRYEPNYYLIQYEGQRANAATIYRNCLIINTGENGTLTYYEEPREVDDNVWEVIEQVG